MLMITFIWPRPPDALTVLGEIEPGSQRFVLVHGVPLRGGKVDIHDRASWLIRKDSIIAAVRPYATPRG